MNKEVKQTQSGERWVVTDFLPVKIGDPAVVPHDLVTEISQYLKTTTVKKAFLKWMEMDGKRGYLLILDTENGGLAKFSPSIGEIIEKYAKQGKLISYVDIVINGPGFAENVESSKPFYIKEKYQ